MESLVIGMCLLRRSFGTLGWPISCDACKKSKAIWNEENRKQWRIFPKLNIDMATQWQVLSVRSLTSQLYMLQCINKQHPSTCCFAAKHPKTQQIAVTDMLQKPVDFFLLCRMGVDFSSRNNFANLGFFAKVFAFV